jgi:hypothetical protein
MIYYLIELLRFAHMAVCQIVKSIKYQNYQTSKGTNKWHFLKAQFIFM